MIIIKSCWKTLPNSSIMYFLSLEPCRSRQGGVGESLSPSFKCKRKLPKFCGSLQLRLMAVVHPGHRDANVTSTAGNMSVGVQAVH